MANREALRELQVRLAGRLQSAKDTGLSVAWLAVEAGGKRYLLPLGQAGEIFPWTYVLSVPYTHPWFLGVANLRGGLYGVIDLAGMVSTSGALAARSELALTDASLVTLGAVLEVNAALLVDRLVGLRAADVFSGSEPPAVDAPSYFGAVYTMPGGERWQELNLQKLSQSPDFLGIGA
ncbi:MAG TPA: chemotaxis protein CheW [Burkholderiaceae bacterium]